MRRGPLARAEMRGLPAERAHPLSAGRTVQPQRLDSRYAQPSQVGQARLHPPERAFEAPQGWVRPMGLSGYHLQAVSVPSFW